MTNAVATSIDGAGPTINWLLRAAKMVIANTLASDARPSLVLKKCGSILSLCNVVIPWVVQPLCQTKKTELNQRVTKDQQNEEA